MFSQLGVLHPGCSGCLAAATWDWGSVAWVENVVAASLPCWRTCTPGSGHSGVYTGTLHYEGTIFSLFCPHRQMVVNRKGLIPSFFLYVC